ncbi:MAG: hypothetical protein V3R25_10260 [Nitrosomonadaceae bacterium]
MNEEVKLTIKVVAVLGVGAAIGIAFFIQFSAIPRVIKAYNNGYETGANEAHKHEGTTAVPNNVILRICAVEDINKIHIDHEYIRCPVGSALEAILPINHQYEFEYTGGTDDK